MPEYAIIETEAGLTIVELGQETPEQAALRQAGAVADPGPYPAYEDAYDAMQFLQDDEEEDEPR